MATSISKMDAVRQAIGELGKDAAPLKIQEFVKVKFGLDMTPAHVSTYKTSILRGKKGKKATAAKQTTSATTSAPAKGSTLSLSDIETVKGLVGRVGEKNLKSLIGIMGG